MLDKPLNYTDDPDVCTRLIAALLILGWVSLSCFDVIEDLDEIPGQASISKIPDGNSSFKIGMGQLANDMVESTYRAEKNDFSIIIATPATISTAPIFEFRRHFQLHKLYRVFLI